MWEQKHAPIKEESSAKASRKNRSHRRPMRLEAENDFLHGNPPPPLESALHAT